MEIIEFDAIFETVKSLGEKQKNNSWLLVINKHYVSSLQVDNKESIGCHDLGLTVVKDIKRNTLTVIGDETKTQELLKITMPKID
jgi:hypothetical protein